MVVERYIIELYKLCKKNKKYSNISDNADTSNIKDDNNHLDLKSKVFNALINNVELISP